MKTLKLITLFLLLGFMTKAISYPVISIKTINGICNCYPTPYPVLYPGNTYVVTFMYNMSPNNPCCCYPASGLSMQDLADITIFDANNTKYVLWTGNQTTIQALPNVGGVYTVNITIPASFVILCTCPGGWATGVEMNDIEWTPCYQGGGPYFYVTMMHNGPLGIQELKEELPVSSTYFDLLGQSVETPLTPNQVYIRKSKYSNGFEKSDKILIN
jgi:hypothetical protein